MKAPVCFLMVLIWTHFTYAQQNELAKGSWPLNYTYHQKSIRKPDNSKDAICWDITITRTVSPMAFLEVSGPLTYFKILTGVETTAAQLKFIYYKTFDGVDYDWFKKNEVLFILKRKNKKLITQWIGLTPKLIMKYSHHDKKFASEYAEECTCFIGHHD